MGEVQRQSEKSGEPQKEASNEGRVTSSCSSTFFLQTSSVRPCPTCSTGLSSIRPISIQTFESTFRTTSVKKSSLPHPHPAALQTLFHRNSPNIWSTSHPRPWLSSPRLFVLKQNAPLYLYFERLLR